MSEQSGAAWLTTALGIPEGATPFPWQLRLLRRFQHDQLPRALDLPTGLGKTAVMAIWLVARALGAPVPRRLVYLVDRRAVVDQATEVAEGLMRLVGSSVELREALGLTGPLPISTLRGQHIDNRAWLADPASPSIVIGTVDMIGSRLLFGGYGVSRKMRPYHAGLLGCDALVVLDEAHLVPPFERLLDHLGQGDDAQGRTLRAADGSPHPWMPTMRVLTLSATGRERAADETFTLDDDDLLHPVVKQRLHAPKRIQVTDAVDAAALPEVLAQQAWALCAGGRDALRIIVFANSRDHAQKVKLGLQKLAGKSVDLQADLFVGARRVYERDQAAARLAELGFLAGSAKHSSGPTFVMATSAGEVGVDLDADHAVCDVVAWERMVQRLGRVNRRGTGFASVVVVPELSSDEAKQARQSAVVGALRLLPADADKLMDGSPHGLAGLKASPEARAAIARASTPARLHPPLTRALVDAWAMTSLDQHTGRPEIAPWLRGWPDEPEDKQVCLLWRRHLPITDDGQVLAPRQLEQFLDAAGTHLSERLEVDLPQALNWLLQRAKALPVKASDAAPTAGADELQADVPLTQRDVAVVLVNDADGRAQAWTSADLLAANKRQLEYSLGGATVWIDRRLGGLSSDGLLDDSCGQPAVDVTELGSLEQPGPVPFRVTRVGADDTGIVDPGWRVECSLPLRRSDDGVLAWLQVSSPINLPAGSEEGRSGARNAQLLSEHQAWAESVARRLGESLRLPPEYAEMLAVAALVHDEGKQVERWQQAFHAPNHGRPAYAKTVGRPDLAVLAGYRHEFGSLPFAEAHPQVQALAPQLRELCLHLVAAHHGAARPYIRTEGAPEPPARAKLRAQAVALRYAALSERWGPWGLAWWEALLRAADQQASRRNDEEGKKHG